MIRKAWRTMIVLMCINILRKYIIWIWFPVSWNINAPWREYDFECNKAGIE